MATTTTILGLIKPSYTDAADVSVINTDMDAIDTEAGKVRGNFAGEYSESSAYAVGDYCTHEGNLYRCTTAIATGGETWNSGHWSQVSIGERLATVEGQVSGKIDTSAIANNLTTTSSGYVLDARQGKTLNDSISGKVTGPSSVTDGTIPLYDGTTGKAIKAGKSITDVTSSTAIANNANMPTNRTVRNCIYNGLDKTAAGFALDARQGAALHRVLSITNSGVTTIKITTSSTLDAKDLFLIMHKNSDSGLTLVSGNGTVNNLINSSSAGLTASVSGNTITMSGNNLYYAKVTVIGGVNFTLSAGA